MLSTDQINQKINNAKSLDFEGIFNNCLELFKKIWLKGFLMVLLLVMITIIITFVLSMFGFGPDATLTDWDEDLNLFSYYRNNALSTVPQSILSSTVIIGVLSGYYRICRNVDLNESENEDWFYFFRGNLIKKTLVLGMIYSLIIAIAQWFYLIPLIYVYVPLSFFSVIYSFNAELTESDIVTLSFRLGNKKWLFTFALLILTAIMGMLGFIACGIGVLFTVSIAYLPAYFIYKEIIGFDEDRDVDFTGFHIEE